MQLFCQKDIIQLQLKHEGLKGIIWALRFELFRKAGFALPMPELNTRKPPCHSGLRLSASVFLRFLGAQKCTIGQVLKNLPDALQATNAQSAPYTAMREGTSQYFLPLEFSSEK
ncbi:hypothetical protein DWQ65_06500 [Treponema phagedenis]|nr:hypothetical protein C5O78_12545 [Treponema phagedenis]QSH99717.1 hypothetical protein DWQ65_06500 [Treponema phagedenis]